MRLTKIKLAGFKSFVDPTAVGFPSNLTGVVGPNGCGKSNIIDAVRWVMGELSAKHLRGDSMADVIFNGSASRKPVGTASVELVFDNSRRQARRPVRRLRRSLAASAWCRATARLDVFPQRRALPPQGHHAAVPRHRPGLAQLRDHRAGHDLARHRGASADDLRAFVEEAAGISKYKERRKRDRERASPTRAKTSSACSDVRDEVDKQIRHLQRQAATARRYQALKEDERRLTAELLALRLREIDSGAAVAGQARCASASSRCMQALIADQRAAEAAIETQRVLSDRAVRARERACRAATTRSAPRSRAPSSRSQHARELRAAAAPGPGAGASRRSPRRTCTSTRDQRRSTQLRAEIEQLEPDLERCAQAASARSAEALAQAEAVDAGLAASAGKSSTASCGAAHQKTQVERARIEQLEHQLHSPWSRSASGCRASCRS